jgi:hypothetical protein
VGAERALRRDRLAKLLLLRERKPVELREPARFASRLDPGPCELRAVERRALEEVLELVAVGDVVERQLLVPRSPFDLRVEHHRGEPSGGS